MPIKLLDDVKFDFEGLFVFEMANNHQGSVEHGKKIIREVAEVAKKMGVKAAVKLQFRDLESFIHPNFRQNSENKHIQRFLSTRLTEEQFAELVQEIKANGLLAMCTPFDEPSVDLIKKLQIEILKIGSCSAKDWPLLEKAAKAGLPMIVSTGGLAINEVDNLVSFLSHRYVNFAIMHCIAIYPTPMEKLQLHHIDRLLARYPGVTIGFSTHEEPDNLDAIKMAYAKGARMFERHVGVPTDAIKLNGYSSNPVQIESWLTSHQQAVAACADNSSQRIIEDQEEKDLFTLQRGVFVNKDVKKGEVITRGDVFFAFPIQPGQLPSGKWVDGLVADRDYAKLDSVSEVVDTKGTSSKEIVYQAIHEIKGMLNQAHIAMGTDFSVELSHHYGIDRFREVGTTIIDCINREYCKKILIQLPGQQHPYHHHKKKEETFQVLAGEMMTELEGNVRVLHPGETVLVQRGVKHRFWSENGAIIEEISSTHFNDDSIYDDPVINEMPREKRKTRLMNWGRHQFD